MKLIAIGDLHGRNDWQKIVAKNGFDTCVFMGDYFDTFQPITPLQQMQNFKRILDCKSANPGKIVLLTGNHDYHYLRSVEEQYSGFQPLYKAAFGDLLHHAINKFWIQACFLSNTFLFSHAGITKTWASLHNIDMSNLQQSVNDLFRYRPGSFAFTPGKNQSPSGDDSTQSPFWVRPNSLRKDRIDGYTQIVGHTIQKSLLIKKDIVVIDTIETSGEYLQIIDDEMSVLRLNN